MLIPKCYYHQYHDINDWKSDKVCFHQLGKIWFLNFPSFSSWPLDFMIIGWQFDSKMFCRKGEIDSSGFYLLVHRVYYSLHHIWTSCRFLHSKYDVRVSLTHIEHEVRKGTFTFQKTYTRWNLPAYYPRQAYWCYEMLIVASFCVSSTHRILYNFFWDGVRMITRVEQIQTIHLPCFILFLCVHHPFTLLKIC